MKKKGLLVVLFFGGIMVTSGFGLQSMMVAPPSLDDPTITITGTPADNFPDDQRAQFCGSGTAQSTDYVQEFSIPTPCTNPLSIVTDYDGNVWFAQTNTGNVAKFDPVRESFTEYDNPTWPPGGRSMMWGMDYAPDGSVWFTDEAHDIIWQFSTFDEEYNRLAYPSTGDSLPQRLLIDGSQIIINDFTGGQITFMNPTSNQDDANYLSIPSPLNNSATSDFTLDDDDNVWYTNWLFQQGGALIKFKQNDYRAYVTLSGQEFLPLSDFIDIFILPPELSTPNGVTITDDGTVWLADTTSSAFFSFDPVTAQFTRYTTADPLPSTYGNLTGVVKSPISRPYWIESDSLGRVVFNEQTANNISVMNPVSETLVEYHVPSKNPGWGDCDAGDGVLVDDCGVAQIFDFAIDGEKIWFTEWVENNIGVVDTSVPLPIDVSFPSGNRVSLTNGTAQIFDFAISPTSSGSSSSSSSSSATMDTSDVSLVATSGYSFISVQPADDSFDTFELTDNAEDGESTTDTTISVLIYASSQAQPGTYKILLGGQLPDVAVSKYITVTVT